MTARFRVRVIAMRNKAYTTTTTERFFIMICSLPYVAWREVSLNVARRRVGYGRTEEAERDKCDMAPGHSSRRSTMDKATSF